MNIYDETLCAIMRANTITELTDLAEKIGECLGAGKITGDQFAMLRRSIIVREDAIVELATLDIA